MPQRSKLCSANTLGKVRLEPGTPGKLTSTGAVSHSTPARAMPALGPSAEPAGWRADLWSGDKNHHLLCGPRPVRWARPGCAKTWESRLLPAVGHGHCGDRGQGQHGAARPRTSPGRTSSARGPGTAGTAGIGHGCAAEWPRKPLPTLPIALHSWPRSEPGPPRLGLGPQGPFSQLLLTVS